MPMGTSDEGIFGSPDLFDSCCTSEGLSRRFGFPVTDYVTPFIWPPNDGVAFSFALRSDDSLVLPLHSNSSSSSISSASNKFSETIESGDDEDILDLISSSLDKFNAQFHQRHQTSGLGHQTPYARRDVSIANALANANSTNFTRLGLPLWESGVSEAHQQQNPNSPQNHNQNSNTKSLSLCCQPSQSSSASLQGSPLSHNLRFPGLSQVSTDPPVLNMRPTKKLQQLPHTIQGKNSDSLWESPWKKTISSEMGMLNVDSAVGSESFLHTPLFQSNSEQSFNRKLTPLPLPDEDHRVPQSQFPISTDTGTTPAVHFTDTITPETTIKNVGPTVASTTAQLPTANTRFRSLNCLESLSPLSKTNQHSRLMGTPQPHPCLDDKQKQVEMALFFSMLETPLRRRQQLQQQQHHHQQQQQQQQRSRIYSNRRKTESLCSSLVPLTSKTSANSNNNNFRSHSFTGVTGNSSSLPATTIQDGLCQRQCKQYANNASNIITKESHQRMMTNFIGNSGTGALGAARSVGHQALGDSYGMRRTEARPPSASCSPASSVSTSDRPVIAKWRRACSFYLRGHCKKEDCEFAHDLTKVTCKFWEVGECFKGATCPFLHGYPPELIRELHQARHVEHLVSSI